MLQSFCCFGSPAQGWLDVWRTFINYASLWLKNANDACWLFPSLCELAHYRHCSLHRAGQEQSLAFSAPEGLGPSSALFSCLSGCQSRAPLWGSSFLLQCEKDSSALNPWLSHLPGREGHFYSFSAASGSPFSWDQQIIMGNHCGLGNESILTNKGMCLSCVIAS